MVNKLLNPLKYNFKYFLILALIIYIPSFIYWIKNFSPYLKYYGILALPCCVFSAYIIVFFVSLLKNRYRKGIKYFIFILIYLLVIIETYIIVFFGTRFSLSVISMILETNPSEASGFVRHYILSPLSYKYIIWVVFFSVILLCLRRFILYSSVDVFNKLISNKVIKYLLFFFITISLSLGIFRAGRSLYWHKYNIDEIGRVRKYSFYSTLYTTQSTLYDSFRLYYLSSRDISVLVSSLQNTKYDQCDYISKNIVLVLGESLNKHHSSLYGYALDTNPLLSKEKNLYIMHDVITSDRLTSSVMKNIFSFRTKDNDIYWAQSTLFPAIFKQAGYYCTFMSNQENGNTKLADIYDMANNYLVSPKVTDYLWDSMNNMKYQYDMQLIDEYTHSHKFKMNTYNLTIFHLLGQHTAYVDRYPEEYEYFTEEDYKFRTDLSIQQKMLVAEYDNAVRYGDAVLESIIDLYREDDTIIIFFSDHGEEIYDYRDYMGRSHEPIITAGMAKYVFEVPFLIWMSDKYKQEHPDIVKRVENSIDKPYVIDDVPHLLLDLAGIRCCEFEPSRSLISNEDTSFTRLIHESMQDYDRLRE